MESEPAIAVVVQRMVNSDVAGVAFSADPATGDRASVVIEAALGLGEVVVSGQVEPDTYVVAKDGLRIKSAHIGLQTHQISRGMDGRDVVVPIESADRSRRVLTDEQIRRVAELTIRVESHYGVPQDIEWAFESDRLWLVQEALPLPSRSARAGPLFRSHPLPPRRVPKVLSALMKRPARFST